MLDRLKAMFGRDAAPKAADADLPLALAALLVEAARADERYEDHERSVIEGVMAERFSLNAAEAAAVRERGEKAQEAALDLHRFTKIAKAMPDADKRDFVEALWRVVLSDGERDSYEEMLIRRVCGLIYVSDQESGAARQRVLASR